MEAIRLLAIMLGSFQISSCHLRKQEDVVNDPGNCSYLSCPWEISGWTWEEYCLGKTSCFYLLTLKNTLSGVLQSRFTAPLQTETSCLKFKYSTFLDRSLQLTVSISDFNASDKVLWNVYGADRTWIDGRVPIKVSQVFSIKIVGTRHTSSGKIVMNKITFERSPCSSWPERARVTSNMITNLIIKPTTVIVDRISENKDGASIKTTVIGVGATVAVVIVLAAITTIIIRRNIVKCNLRSNQHISGETERVTTFIGAPYYVEGHGIQLVPGYDATGVSIDDIKNNEQSAIEFKKLSKDRESICTSSDEYSMPSTFDGIAGDVSRMQRDNMKYKSISLCQSEDNTMCNEEIIVPVHQAYDTGALCHSAMTDSVGKGRAAKDTACHYSRLNEDNYDTVCREKRTVIVNSD